MRRAERARRCRSSGELEDARWFTREELLAGPPLLPPSQSISYRLITAWLRHPELVPAPAGDR